MDSLFLELPDREVKPRRRGLTMTIDNGIAHGAFADEINTAAPYIDVVKFGWGTALVTPDIERKFEVLRDLGIGYYFGGTLFEKFVRQDRFESFLTLCRLCDCRFVEVSNGTMPMSNHDKADYIRRCSDEFTVLSEVGFKDPGRSAELTPEWVEAIHIDLDAGASLVITEARESGKSGICRPDGTPRQELVDAILGAGSTSTACSSRHPPRICRPTSSTGWAPTSIWGTSPPPTSSGSRPCAWGCGPTPCCTSRR